MNIHVRIWTLYEAVCNNVLVGQGCGGLILTAVSDIYSTTYILAYLEHISTSCILLAYDRLECPVAPLSGASRPPRGLG